MEKNLDEIIAKLKRYNQLHLLDYYNKLEEGELKEKFLEQLEKIDFELIDSIYRSTEKEKDQEDDIQPIEYWDKERLGGKYDFYKEIGEEAIKNGKLAVVTMAGGQGTRLGHNGPKGTYDIGLDSHKSLFEILSDNLKEAKKQYGVEIPWFIMTSEENNKQTVEFFEKNKYFGLKKDKVFFFNQGQLPMVDTEGKILIGENGLIKEAADGHGGVYASLVKNGMTKKMKELGIEWVCICGIDNCLANIVDPVFLGLTIYKEVTGGSKSVVKANPQEKVGVFCKKNGKPGIVEYSEISKEMTEATNEMGELLYGESNIINHLFKVETIEKMGSMPLPYHIAYKKATYIDKDRNLVVPTSPNAYKFEAFMFDAFGDLDDMVVFRVKREEEFAPVKNAEGVDSPETARKLYNNFHKKNK